MERENLPFDYSHEEIHPPSDNDMNLYGSLRRIVKNINVSDLSWQDPEAKIMKCALPVCVLSKCDDFVKDFKMTMSRDKRDIFHDNNWKESEEKLVEITKCILNVLDETWRNSIFMSSASRSEQSKGTYISDVLLPLLCLSLSDLLHGNICLSTAER
ncbi:hypothetical protein RhiirC2_788668 [Rhizophagus irregularis]|uniref:Uncharacterized protein n=1 Tax=Rhizophagus irregularis TaxID=588596 RepID=A0A2N1MPP9_9GLOM|nr:hypothetical protein RhiirC2_788668 [Rhizophagus irregularis]